MNPVFVPAHWASSMPAGPRVAQRRAEETAADGADGCATWVLQRRCALTPRQLGLCFLALAAVSLLMAVIFWAVGAPFVALFSGIELVALSAAFGWHVLHAADGERLCVEQHQLRVEQRCGLRQTQVVLDLKHLRVSETVAGTVELRSAGRRVLVGAELGALRRRQVAADLRRLALN